MDLIQLTEFIVKSLVDDKESVSVKEMTSEDDDVIEINVLVKDEDMSRVIGRGGKIANSIRTLVQASSYLQDNKRVKIEIDKY